MSDYKKDQIRGEILESLNRRGCNTPVFRGMVADFLEFSEILEDLNQRADDLKDDPKKVRSYLAYIGEARRVHKSMIDILDFLGVTEDLRNPVKANIDL